MLGLKLNHVSKRGHCSHFEGVMLSGISGFDFQYILKLFPFLWYLAKPSKIRWLLPLSSDLAKPLFTFEEHKIKAADQNRMR